MMFVATVRSKESMPERVKDFIVELASEEARKVALPFFFIVHDAEESERQSELLIEGTPRAAASLVSMLRDNLPYRVIVRRVE